MFKPTRGASKPTLRSSGINQFALIKFLEECQRRLEVEGDQHSAFRFEMVKTYFQQDYEEGKPLRFTGQVLGL